MSLPKRRKLEAVDTCKYPDVSVVLVNWDVRVICQKKSHELPQTPTLSGCATLANNLTEFVSREALPISINLS